MAIIIQPPSNISAAYERIKDYVDFTPIITSEILDNILNHHIYFKADALQKTGSFKVRGALNHLLELKEQGNLPQKLVAYSTGNHGIGLAYAAGIVGVKARIYLPKYTSKVKQESASYYGAEVIYTDNRSQAEESAKSDGRNGFYHIHPSDSDTTIAGAGTLCYEALNQLDFKPDAIFASCGGGGLLSGSYLAKELLSPSSLLIGCEPENANDAYLSLKNNSIYKFDSSPSTVADGLRSLALSERTFSYIKKLDDFYLCSEYEIYYWTAWLTHLLKIACEPSSALNMACVIKWLKTKTSPQRVLVLISGGNIDPSLYQELAKEKYLLTPLEL
jgi:threonine dehydratase